MVAENRRIVEDLKMKMDVSNFEVPAGMRRDLENLHAEINNLEGEVRKIKTDKIAPRSNDDMDHLRSELFSKLDDLNVKFGPKSSEEVKKAMEANKASIDRLKALISGEEMSIDSLKQEMNDNRKFMTEIKSVLLSKSATAGKKVTLVQDPDIKTKLSKMEQRIEMLAARLEKLNDLKPIKLPDFEPSPAAAKGAKGMMQVKPGELEVLRREIDTIVSRMDGFLTKDDVEKGFLDKRMKADEKLMTGDIYKDLNEVKKAILRNEDHVTSVASDVERIKKEVGTVEKREWGKVSEIPSVDELKRRIEELEKRIDEVHEGPVFIE
jgi:chromosome segregation ATPase